MAHHEPSPISRRAFIATTAVATLAAMQAEGRSQPPLCAGVIGCGTSGRRVIEAIAMSDGVIRPVVCAARDTSSSLGASIDTEQDWRLLVRRSDLDAVFIATPDHLHAEMAAEFLRAGKHVYIMPPFARSGEEAGRLAALALEYDRILHVGMEPDEVARWAGAKSVLAQSGEPLWIQATATRDETPGALQWQRDRACSHGPAARRIFSMLYPLQHQMAWDAPERATALGGVYHGQPWNTPDRLLMTLRYHGGATVVLECVDSPRGPSLVRGLHGPFELPPVTGSQNLADDLIGFTAAIAGDREESRARLRAACIAQEAVCSAMDQWSRWSPVETGRLVG